MIKKILLILSLFTFISPILFAQAPDSLVGKKLSLNFNVPENDAIGVHEFFLTDSVTSIGNYFKTSNDSSDNPYWLTELFNYKKSDTANGTWRIISSDGGWVDIVLTFSSSTSASSTISGYAKNGTLEWNGTGDVTMTDLAISEIATSYQPNVLTSNFAPTSIAAGSLSAQDKYWPVYDETITFSTSGTFNANITNGSDNPTGSGNYTYTYTGTNSATLSYSIDGAGISFEYALQFTGANTGIYTKYADYGGGNTDITTGPFTLAGVAVPEQFAWEDYDDFNDNSLDVSKWESTNSYFVGNQPTETNGRIELTGLNSQNSQKNTFLILKDLDDLVGVEADIWLPSDAPVDTGVLIGIADAGTPVGFLDLWADSEQTKIYINLGNSATGEAIDFTRNAELGKSYKVAIIKGEQKTALYLDGEKVAEVSTWQSNNLDIIFRGVNDAGSSFTAYLDNVRVLRNWEDYDDFSGSSLDTSKWGTMNFYGGDKPEVKDGRVEFSSSGKSVSATSDFKQGWNSTEFINYTEGAPGSVLYVNDSTVYGMEASVTLPVGSSPKTAICLQVGSLNPFGQHIAELMNDSGNGAGFWIHDYVADTGVSTSASSATTFQVAVIHENEKNTFYINSKKVHEFDASNFTPDWFGINTFENDGKAYTVYADNIRVLRRSNTTTEPDPVTVVSDPNGQAVVVQVGNEYQWKSTLDGVTLWGVEQSSDGWSAMTMRFENGRNFGNQGFFDSVAQPQPYDAPYEIDENGYIKSLEDDGDYQYYNPVSVENGVIGTIQNDEGVDSVANNGINQVDQWFFTTRAAAEEYYYSKVPVTVISDPNGKAVVVQVGNEYHWNSTLDGVTLWSVSASERDAKWSPLTAKFSGGNLLYGFEFKDDVADTGNNKVSYQIDENGYIKSLEDDGDYQYYNPVSVENGVIGTIQNDEGVDSVANNGINQVDQWFFTTRAAAEEYYYSKVGYPNPKGWLWFDQYPWVYSSEEQGWLYFMPSGGKLMYYSHKSKVWREFNQ